MVDWTEWSKEVKVRLNWMSNSKFCPTRHEAVLAHQRTHAYATPAKKTKEKENTPVTKQNKTLQTTATSASTADMTNWQLMDVWHGRSAERATCLRRQRRRGGRGGQGSGTWQMLVPMEVAMARRAHVDFFGRTQVTRRRVARRLLSMGTTSALRQLQVCCLRISIWGHDQ